MAKNVNSVQLLRNTSQLYATREAALAALTASTVPGGTQDGTPVLARYKNSENKIMTLVGYYAVANDITGGSGLSNNMTVFDFEGNASDITELTNKIGTGVTTANTVTAQLETLSGTNSDTSASTSVAGAKKYTDGKLDALDASTVSGESKVVYDVTQANGKITASAKNMTGVKLAGFAEGTSKADIATSDTLGAALGKLQYRIKSMDLTTVSGDGQVITAVSQADGVVSASKASIKDVKLTGYSKDSTKTGALAATDDFEDALSKIENNIAAAQSATTLSAADKSVTVTTASTGTTVKVNIKSGAQNQFKLDSANGVYTNLYVSGITPTSSNVKEEYALFNDGTQVASGTTIKVYKDSSIVEIYLGTSGDTVDPDDGTVTKLSGDKQYLNYVYQKSDGKYEITHINISSFLNEAEFASGVTWDDTDGKVRGVVDSTSEKVITSYNSDGTSASTGSVLTVGANGFKISNIQTAINKKIETLDATVSGGSTAGTATSNHVKVTVVETNGKLTSVTVNEANIANKSDLDTLSGKTFTQATSTNSSITTAVTAASDGTKSVDLITDASKIKMSGFTSDVSGFTGITDATSIKDAFKSVEGFILDNEQVISSALNDLESRKAEDADLTAEIEARKAVDGQNGQTYVANSGKKYISGATSLNDADIRLNDALESIAGGWIADVKVNGQKLPESANAVDIQISASTTYASSANAIVITQDNTTKGLTFALGTIDAGTY